MRKSATSARPLTPLKQTSFDHDGQRIWHHILEAEKYALTTPRTASPKDWLIGIRVLGHLFEDFWNHCATSPLGSTPFQRMKLELKKCLEYTEHGIGSESDQEVVHDRLCQLGLFYRNFMMKVFRSSTDPRPVTPSDHPSQLSFEHDVCEVVGAIEEPSKSQKEVKKAALFRDSHRCVLSGYFDEDSVRKYTHIEEKCINEENHTVSTEVAHIFLESAQETDPEYGATALAQSTLFGLGGAIERILAGNVHSLENVMTITSSLQRGFSRMNSWLEPVDNEPNTYNVCGPDAENRLLFIKPKKQITFTISPEIQAACNATGKPLPPLPNAELLALRAACSRVAHLSGAAKRADEILEDLEGTMVLAHDGSMAELLAARLSMIPMSSVAMQCNANF